MDEIKIMLKAVINGQHALRKEFSDEINKLRKELKKEMKDGFAEVNIKFDEVNARLDKQRKQLAYLEDDAPTKTEHDTLKKRVEKVEQLLPH